MKKEFYLIIVLFACCLFCSSCSENLYNVKDLRPNQANANIPQTDTVRTLLALTPLRGVYADSLKHTGLLDVQETANYQQALPNAVDVVYVNADFATAQLAESSIFEEALAKSTLLIDGSKENIEKFCEKYLPITFPGAEMVAYQSHLPGEKEFGLSTVAFGPQDNPLSTGMLLASLWAYTPKPNTTHTPYPKFNPTTTAPPEITTVPIVNLKKDNTTNDYNFKAGDKNFKIANVNSLRCEGKCQGAEGLNVINEPWWWLFQVYCNEYPATIGGFYYETGDRYRNPDASYFRLNPDGWGCHYFNIPILWDVVYSSGKDYGSDLVTRQSCWDNEPLKGGNISWQNNIYWRQDPQKLTSVASSGLIKFNQTSAKLAYLDMNVINGYSKSWGVTHASGAELGIGWGPLTVSVAASYSNGTVQSTTITRSSQREFWINDCMYAISGGKTIYGQVAAYTMDRYIEGTSEFNLQIRYIESGVSSRDPRTERTITYCIRQGAPSGIIGSFSGEVRTSKYVWISTTWYNKNQERIWTFKNCKR